MMGSRSKAKALGVPKGLRILYASETSAHLNCNCLAKGKARRLPAKVRISPEKHGNHGCNGSCEAAKATAKAKYSSSPTAAAKCAAVGREEACLA
jgi:hypothetical protein